MSKAKAYFAREASGLVRPLRGVDILFGSAVGMGIAIPMTLSFFTVLLYPGANLQLTVLTPLIVGTLGGVMYYLLTLSMPRTGGDYVWASRIIHPVVGFVTNFTMAIIFLAFGAAFMIWIPIYGFAPMFAALGMIESNPSYSALAVTFASAPTSYYVAIIASVCVLLPPFFGTKTTFRFMWICFVVIMVGMVATIYAFFSAPQATFIANFNQLSGMNYNETIRVAGLPSGFSLSATALGSVYTVFAFIGFNFSSYYAGEVKDVRKDLPVGILGAVYFFAAIMFVLFTGVYYSVGADFFNAISNLAGTGNSYYTLASPPVVNYLVAFAMPNSTIVILATLGYVVSMVPMAMITNFFVPIRNMFAWSFDGLMPSALSRVGTRWSSPYVAVAVAAAIYAIFGVLYFTTPLPLMLTYGLAGELLSYIIAGVCAILLPFLRKDIFDASQKIVRKRIGGLPLISVIGVLTALSFGFLTYASVTPAFTPPPGGAAPLVIFSAYVTVPLIALVAFVIYLVMLYYRRSQGIDLRWTFKEIPPG